MQERRADALALLSLVALITILFADVLFLGQSFFGRDVQYHHPMKHVVRQAMLSGEFPYWNRLLEAGQPLAANPAYELFYPPQWLVLLPDFRAGYDLHILLHVYLAAVGMYVLARVLRLRISVALFAALAFGLGGPVLGFTGAMLPFLFSMTWLPWIAAFVVRYHRARRGIDFALAALVLAMQFLIGEPVVLLQTLAVLFIAALFFERRLVPHVIALIVAAFCLAGIQIVPAIDHAGDSVRAEPFQYSAVRTWSFPPERIIEPFFPRFAGEPDVLTYAGRTRFYQGRVPFVASVYAGLLAAVLLLAGLVTRRPGWTFVATILAGAYVVALGDHTPLLRVLYELGPFRAIRYPEKFVLVASFLAIVFAARVFEDLLAGDERLRRTAMIIASVVCAIAAAAWLISFLPSWPEMSRAYWRADVAPHLDASRTEWLLAAMRAAALAVLLARLARLPRAAAVLLLFTIVDLLPVTNGLSPREDSRFLDAPPLLRALAPPGQRTFPEAAAMVDAARVEVPLPLFEGMLLDRNALAPYWPLAWGRETVIGIDYDETNLQASHRFRLAALIARQQNLPAYPRQFMSMANATVRLASPGRRAVHDRLRQDGVEAVTVDVVREPVAAPRYRFATSTIGCGDMLDCLARMRVDEGAVLVPGRSIRVASGTVEQVVETANTARLRVRARGTALLVTSVTDHKYWTATVDGNPVPIGPANLAFQGVLVPAGEHQVVFRYRNPLVATGGALSAASLLMLALFVAYDARRAVAGRSS